MNRRFFLKIGIGSTVGLAMSESRITDLKAAEVEPRFKISLAQWSLKGFIGLQNYDENSAVKFKNIRLQEL